MRPSSHFLKFGAAALLVLTPIQATAKTYPRVKPPACDTPAVTVEQGVTVYRAAARPWRTEAERRPEPIRTTRVIVRPYRYNYLAVDTRPRGEWGPVNAVYQKF